MKCNETDDANGQLDAFVLCLLDTVIVMSTTV